MAQKPVSPNIDVYDEEFNRNLLIAKKLIPQIRRKEDRQICGKWIKKLCDMRSCDVAVKKNRNQFFKYMLTILHRAVDDRPKAKEGFPQYDEKHGAVGGEGSGDQGGFRKKWSRDKRTYVAVKPIPGKGALVYMACTKYPELGWDYAR